jgi:hypothetical protein
MSQFVDPPMANGHTFFERSGLSPHDLGMKTGSQMVNI